jgi:transposase-like protein
MTINYSTIDNLCRQVELLNQDELSILLSKLDRTSRDRLQTEIFDSLSQNTNNGIEYCPYCGGIRINKKGKAHGTQRYICRDCNKTFTSTKNSIFYHFRKDYEPKFKKFIECMVNRLTLIRSAEISGITLMCS